MMQQKLSGTFSVTESREMRDEDKCEVGDRGAKGDIGDMKDSVSRSVRVFDVGDTY